MIKRKNVPPSMYGNQNKSIQKPPFYCRILSIFGKVADKIVNLLDKLYTKLKLADKMSPISAAVNSLGVLYFIIVLIILIWVPIKWLYNSMLNLILGSYGSSINITGNLPLGPPILWFYILVLQKIILAIFIFLIVFSKIKNLKGRISSGSDSLINLILAAIESGSLLCHIIGSFIALGFVISIFLYVCETGNSNDIDLASTYFPLDKMIIGMSLLLLLIIILVQYLSFKGDICNDPNIANKSFLVTLNGTAKTFFILALIYLFFKILENVFSRIVSSSTMGVFKLVGGPDYTISNESCVENVAPDEGFTFLSFLRILGDIGLFILFLVILFIQSPLGIFFNAQKVSENVCKTVADAVENMSKTISPPNAVRTK
jgi:hypothetical protein